MMRISAAYRELQKDLHARYDYGRGVDAGECAEIVRALGADSVVDYGAGQGHLAKMLLGIEVEEYDPCIAGKEEDPSRADVVVCSDVMEHVEPELLGNVLLHIYSLAKKYVLFIIATKPSSKIMSDGRQAHVILENADWWQQKLHGLFEVEQVEDRSWRGNGLLLLCRPRRFSTGAPLVPIAKIRSTSAVADHVRNDNMIANCERIAKRLEIGIEPHGRTAHLACYGPSLNTSWPQMAMAQHVPGNDIYTISGAHRFMIDRGIVPLAHMDCDPREHKAEQIGEPHPGVRYWLASCVHPAYLNLLEGHDVALWHSYNGEASRIAFKIDPKLQMIVGGGSIGLRAMSVLYARGYRQFEIHGMDCSYGADGQNHAGPHLGKYYDGTPVKCGERWFDTCAVLILYARFFHKQLSMMRDATIHLHGDGLLQHMMTIGETE